MAMKKVIINRKRWGKSSLRRNDNHKQCCLGFVCVSYQVEPANMVGIVMPCFLPKQDQDLLPKWLKGNNQNKNTDVVKAAEINDNNDISWADKEKRLKPIFRKHGIQLIFRGKR